MSRPAGGQAATIQDVYRAPTAPPPRETHGIGLYAGFWRRAAAYLIDSLIMLVPTIAVGIVVKGGWLGFLLQISCWIVYKVLTEAGPWQATIGKRAMGIKVTTLEGNRISVGQAIGRYLGSLLSGLILCIGYIMAGMTRRRQALHDMMASTLVVNTTATEDEVAGGEDTSTMRMTAGVWVAVVLILIVPFFGGILAAIAIPAYQDYTVRAKMAEVISEAASHKAEAAQEFARAKTGGPKDAHPVSATSRYLKQVTIDPGHGMIRAEINTVAMSSFQLKPGAEVILTMAGDGSQWTCAGNGIPQKFLPALCRQ